VSKLDNSPSLDGVRDVMFPNPEESTISSGNTSSNVSLGSDKVRFRMGLHGGAEVNSTTDLALPWTYSGSSYSRRNDYPHTATSKVMMSDLRYSFRLNPEIKTYTSSSTKTSTTRVFTGWCTAAAMTALSGATTGRTAQGIGVSNGTNHYNSTQVMPFDSINSNHDGNKWLCGLISRSDSSGGLFPTYTYTTYVVFEGAGAQTNDTDWNKIVSRTYDDSTGVFNMANATQPAQSSQYTWSGGSPMGRTNTVLNRSDATVTSYNSRIVYSWADTIFFSKFSMKGTDFTNNTRANQIITFY
jgi:hypothetical protein